MSNFQTELENIIQNIRDDAIATQKGWQGSPYDANEAITTLVLETLGEDTPVYHGERIEVWENRLKAVLRTKFTNQPKQESRL